MNRRSSPKPNNVRASDGTKRQRNWIDYDGFDDDEEAASRALTNGTPEFTEYMSEIGVVTDEELAEYRDIRLAFMREKMRNA